MIRFLATALMLLPSAPLWAGDRLNASGHVPLTDRVFCQWLGRLVDGKSQGLLLVYYRGQPGWRDRVWVPRSTMHNRTGGDEVFWLVSDDVTLSIGLSADRSSALVQGEAFDIEVANVFLVTHVDGPGEESEVQALGRFVLEFDSGMRATAALEAYPELREIVFEDP